MWWIIMFQHIGGKTLNKMTEKKTVILNTEIGENM